MAVPAADLMKGFGAENFPLPKIAGTYKGKGLVVCGDAAGVWQDLEAFGCVSRVGRGSIFKSQWDFLTVNKLVETFPGDIEHAYSNEPWLLEKFIAARRNEYAREFTGPANTHSCNKGARWRWPWSGRGTSALGATLVGLGLGYDAVVLAGVPLDNTAHNGEPPWRRCTFDKEIEGLRNVHWQDAITVAFEGKVKSMSGRTRDWLGAP
jgi:hypothetical protein